MEEKSFFEDTNYIFTNDEGEAIKEVSINEIRILETISSKMYNSFTRNTKHINGIKFNLLNTIEPVIPLIMEINEFIKNDDDDMDKLYKRVIKTCNKYKQTNGKFTYYIKKYNEFTSEFKEKLPLFNQTYTAEDIVSIQNIPESIVKITAKLFFDTIQNNYKKFTRLVDVIYNCFEDSTLYILMSLSVTLQYFEKCAQNIEIIKKINFSAFPEAITYVTCLHASDCVKDNETDIKLALINKLTEDNTYNKNNSVDTTKIDNSIEKLSVSMKSLLDQNVKTLENLKYNTLENTYKNSISILSEKISNQSIIIGEKNVTINNLNNKIAELEEIIFNLKKTINDLKKPTEDELNSEVAATCDERANCNYIDEEEEKHSLGYIKQRNDIFYLITSSGKEIEIDISNHSLFTEGQFVQLNSKKQIIKTYNYIFNTPSINQGNYEFIITRYINGSIKGYIPRLDKYIEIDTNSYKLGINQVVLINKINNKVETVYKKHQFVLDSYKNYIELFVNDIHLVVSKFSNKYIVRNIFTGEESIREDENDNYEIFTLIFEYKDGYTDVINSLTFYTGSSLYNKSKIVTAMILDDYVSYKNEDNNKIEYINNIPENKTIYEGDAIKIDEFNNYIKTLEINGESSDKTKKKRATIKKEKQDFNRDIIEYNVAVVGDIGLQHTYKTVGLKNKFNIDTFDGSLSYTKIKLKLKEYDLILIDPSCIEHDNMYAIRDFYEDVVFLKSNGANRVVDNIKEYFEKNKI